MKKFTLTSIRAFAAAVVLLSAGVMVSHATNYKICGDCHQCRKEKMNIFGGDSIADITCYI